jgi:hypothetical protein
MPARQQEAAFLTSDGQKAEADSGLGQGRGGQVVMGAIRSQELREAVDNFRPSYSCICQLNPRFRVEIHSTVCIMYP